MTQTIRYGLVGAGMMGREHLRNLALIPGSEIAALCDPDEGSRAAAAALAPDAKVFEDHRALLASGLVDALVVASPNDTHAAILLEVLAGAEAVPVLVEKPACTSLEEARALAGAARRHQAPIWVAMEYRYMPPVAEWVREIHGGSVGRLRMLTLREHRFPFLDKVGAWNRFSRRTGGTLVEKCCHFFDLMRLITRDEPVRVYASGSGEVNHREERYDGETPDILDHAYVVVDFRGGTRALLDLCMFAEGAYYQEEFAAVGDRGKAECFVPGAARFWPGGAEREALVVVNPREPKGPVRRVVPVDPTVLHAGEHHGATFYQHLHFRRAILEGAPVEVSLEDGLKALAIGLAAERSVAEKRPVEIDYSPFAGALELAD